MSVSAVAPALPIQPPRHLAAAPVPGVDPDTFRSVFRGHAGGVAVITADSGAGPVGFTATSVVSLSLRPALVSFAISHASSSFTTVQHAESVVINFLAEDQDALATTFATKNIDRFARPTAWSRLSDGAPVLDHAPTYLHGAIEQRFTAGDHQIVVARVHDAEQRRSYSPLVYLGGAYASAVAR